MTLSRTYLDWNATAPLRPQARAAMVDAFDVVGNPSSVHAEGRAARRIIENAREQVALLVGAAPRNVVFTSGATESNNWVHGRAWSVIVHSRLEHPSVLAMVDAAVHPAVAVTPDGTIDLDTLARVVREVGASTDAKSGRALLTLQAANNETGVVQPLAEAVLLAKEQGLLIASDAVQVAGRLPLDFTASGIDYMTISAHKLGGPKGVGAVIVRENAPLDPLIIGGGQERRQRAGTENVAAIAGFGAAAERAAQDVASFADLATLRDDLEHRMFEIVPDAIVIGAGAPRLPNTTCLAFPTRSSETLVAALDLAGIAVSAGAACSSGKVAASHVLEAMSLDPSVARGAIRVSLGMTTTENDIAAFLAAIADFTGRFAKAA